MFVNAHRPQRIGQLLVASALMISALAPGQPVGAQTVQTPALGEVADAPLAVDVTARSEQAIRELGEIRHQLDELGEIDSARKHLRELQNRYRELLPEGTSLQSVVADGVEYDIDNLLTQAVALSKQSTSVTEELSGPAEVLENMQRRVRELAGAWRAALDETSGLAPALEERITGILHTAQGLDELVTGKLDDIVDAQNQALELFESLRPLTDQVRDFDRSERQRLMDFSQPPLWRLSADGLSISMRHSSRGFGTRLVREGNAFLALNGPQIIFHLALLVVLLGLMQALKRNMAASEQRSAALRRPFAAGILVWLLLSLVLYTAMPSTIATLRALALAIAAFTVLVTLIPEKMRTAVYTFVIVFLTDRLAAEFPAGDALPRVLNVGLAGAAEADGPRSDHP